MSRADLRFQGMPERHAELAWRFGEPDEMHEAVPGEGDDSLWALNSPLPPAASLPEHLAWASECLRPHEAFVGELISLGGRVVLRLEIEVAESADPLEIDARLLLPMAHTGVRLEFRFS